MRPRTSVEGHVRRLAGRSVGWLAGPDKIFSCLQARFSYQLLPTKHFDIRNILENSTKYSFLLQHDYKLFRFIIAYRLMNYYMIWQIR